VYVFAITQLSDFLFEHLSWRGVLEALVLFGAVWWAWNYTAWATNRIDPERAPGALLMVARLALWVVALALDVGAPSHGFRLPGVAPTPMERWTLAGGHLGPQPPTSVLETSSPCLAGGPEP